MTKYYYAIRCKEDWTPWIECTYNTYLSYISNPDVKIKQEEE